MIRTGGKVSAQIFFVVAGGCFVVALTAVALRTIRPEPSATKPLESALPHDPFKPTTLNAVPSSPSASHVTNQDDIGLLTTLTDHYATDTARNEAAVRLRQARSLELTDSLMAVLRNLEEKERFRSFAVQHLWAQLPQAGPTERDRIRDTLRELLTDRHLVVRRECLLALVRERDPLGVETAVRWLTEPDTDEATKRDLAVRCVQELDLREYIPVIRAYAQPSGRDAPPTSEVVRIAALNALSLWGDESSRPAFQLAATSTSPRIQRAGRAALERLDRAAKR